MSTPTAAPSAVPSVDSRHRVRVRRRVRSWVTRPLMTALVLAQGYASWGTHGLGVWAGLAWLEAWIPVLLIDAVVVVTAHAATAGMLPAKGDDRERLRGLAWRIAMIGFAFGLVANVLHRHVTAPAGAVLGQTVIADVLAGAPTLLVLVCLVFRGRMEDYVERLLIADDTEQVAADQAAAARVEREQRREQRRQQAPAPALEVPTPAAPPAPAAEAVEPVGERHDITGDVPASTDPKVTVYDRLIASEWAAGENRDGAWFDGQIGGAYGRKQLAAWRDCLAMIVEDEAAGVPLDAGTLEDRLRERRKQAKGTTRIVLAYVAHQRAAGRPLFPPGISEVSDPDSGETPTVTADGNAA